MFMPQSQTKTPILGSCPRTSVSAVSLTTVSILTRFSQTNAPAFDAAPEASATVVGMSLGAANAPLTNTPFLDVSNGVYIPVSYTHLRAHETGRNLVCRLLLEKKK